MNFNNEELELLIDSLESLPVFNLLLMSPAQRATRIKLLCNFKLEQEKRRNAVET